MSHQVLVSGTEIRFPCEPGETVLAAAERAGYALPYSCRKGVCASCEGGLVAGSADVRGRGPVHGRGPVRGRAEEVLLCQTRPCTDLEVAVRRVSRSAPPERRTVRARLHKVTAPAPDVAVLQLRFPAGVRVPFRAGQYLTVALPDGDTRNYSMANPPGRSDGALLHVRRVPDGRFSGPFLDGLARGDVLTVELPFGEFGVDDSACPVLLVVTGTGFAPAKSIVEHLAERGGGRPVWLYWGGRRPADLYQADLAGRWAAKYEWFRFVPVLSRPDPGWAGHTGYVQDAVLRDHPDLRGHLVCACGGSAMTSAARKAFLAAGLPEERFVHDTFVASSGKGR
ncbi:CDP-6-deoxy-delta-3,4-glucoseen reductase [Pseudonocardia eucalypti]|uniref:CDP-6-deoxy-delta-3,4-glucoseen reductase n=1 Tax=Pseudonocardia eucalypti TaxID=648755 RepID=A0ABP9QQD0_9PSEU|nr:CDP-4-dehydro-6-deoxyglucose reductase/3-phenylpropionate/trans-cinnamate dioxygenase ferredoxin reductase subunit [Pseudonocardia eucalypti]